MATYLYETIPQSEGELPERFEMSQSMKDAPLTHHPETGKPVRRVITGGFGFCVRGGPSTRSLEASQGPCCQGPCDCAS